MGSKSSLIDTLAVVEFVLGGLTIAGFAVTLIFFKSLSHDFQIGGLALSIIAMLSMIFVHEWRERVIYDWQASRSAFQPSAPALRYVPRGSSSTSHTTQVRDSDDDDDFALSMAVGATTDNAVLGYAAGGSLMGGLVGQSLRESSSGDQSDGSDASTRSSCDSDTDSSDYSSGSDSDSWSSCDSGGSSGGED